MIAKYVPISRTCHAIAGAGTILAEVIICGHHHLPARRVLICITLEYQETNFPIVPRRLFQRSQSMVFRLVRSREEARSDVEIGLELACPASAHESFETGRWW